MTGLIIDMLLKTCIQWGEATGVDIVICVADRPHFSMIQARRLANEELYWPKSELEPRLRQKALELAEFVQVDRLAIFLGAGISSGAGLPTWMPLLDKIEQETREPGVPHKGEVTGWGSMSSTERCHALVERLGGTKAALNSAIAARLVVENFSLMHSLLASLPVKHVVTTNYDQLYEEASYAVEVALKDKSPYSAAQGLSIIPFKPQMSHNRWLLKMHGCVSSPKDIITTNEEMDFISSGRNMALTGMVQATLMTSHMLFIGFSMADKSYSNIVEQASHSMASHSMASHSMASHSMTSHSVAPHSITMASHSMASHSMTSHSIASHSMA